MRPGCAAVSSPNDIQPVRDREMNNSIEKSRHRVVDTIYDSAPEKKGKQENQWLENRIIRDTFFALKTHSRDFRQ